MTKFTVAYNKKASNVLESEHPVAKAVNFRILFLILTNANMVLEARRLSEEQEADEGQIPLPNRPVLKVGDDKMKIGDNERMKYSSITESLTNVFDSSMNNAKTMETIDGKFEEDANVLPTQENIWTSPRPVASSEDSGKGFRKQFKNR
ncbi:hypothetical protein CAEBREN_13673 [Caenorhabditis brenneri]|uniref:Uncharacterized protein n=1 Tax=Caenorhabditis brenneri TaxID=135651 RepID=G0NDG2_CAEBE|nr:hypothetical protein CAEBREN_13673 [Caenorhabditis brenneri]